MKPTLIIPFLAILASCNQEPQPAPIATPETNNPSTNRILDRLIGDWKNEDGMSYEKWIKNSDTTYLSFGYKLNGADTVYAERVTVSRRNGEWFSENTVPNQNNGLAVPFKITQLTANDMHFNNPEHDFPTDIHYTLMNDSTIHAYIVGPNESGGKDTIPFNFIRL